MGAAWMSYNTAHSDPIRKGLVFAGLDQAAEDGQSYSSL